MSECPKCGMRDDDWFLCRKDECAVKTVLITGRPIAAPKFSIGEIVRYRDHHKRFQEGEVLAIEATWNRWPRAKEVSMLIQYTVSHPSYHNRQMYISEASIVDVHGEPGELHFSQAMKDAQERSDR